MWLTCCIISLIVARTFYTFDCPNTLQSLLVIIEKANNHWRLTDIKKLKAAVHHPALCAIVQSAYLHCCAFLSFDFLFGALLYNYVILVCEILLGEWQL